MIYISVKYVNNRIAVLVLAVRSMRNYIIIIIIITALIFISPRTEISLGLF